MTVAFDTLRFSQRLQQSGVRREQAEVHAELARDMLLTEDATKADLAALRLELDGKLDLLEQRMTVRVGAMLAAAVGIIIAAQQLLERPQLGRGSCFL